MAGETRMNIVQGEYYVSADPAVVITTLLGSCVAACLYDRRMRVGGMNHFLLPGRFGDEPEGQSERLGVHLMELLVNGLLKLGASRDRMEAKLFGGAKTVAGLRDIGANNAVFAQSFLRREGIPVVATSLGANSGRRVQFWPTMGRARQQFMTGAPVEPPAIRPPVLPTAGDLELF